MTLRFRDPRDLCKRINGSESLMFKAAEQGRTDVCAWLHEHGAAESLELTDYDGWSVGFPLGFRWVSVGFLLCFRCVSVGVHLHPVRFYSAAAALTINHQTRQAVSTPTRAR